MCFATRFGKIENRPEGWITLIFVPIPKKGNVMGNSNKRTVYLFSHCSKILLKVIARRIKNKIKFNSY